MPEIGLQALIISKLPILQEPEIGDTTEYSHLWGILQHWQGAQTFRREMLQHIPIRQS